VSRLERRSRLLLRAYPAAYRRDRGDEILGTLAEATPPERDWPRWRDIRGLIAGGLRARAALNRQLTTTTNLRTAVLVGVAAYLSFSTAAAYAGTGLVSPAGATLLTAPLIAATVLLAWVSRRRVLVLAAALPAIAAVCYAGPWGHYVAGDTVTRLVCVAALTALSGGTKRPSLRWLWPVGVVAAVPILASIGPDFLAAALLLGLGAASIAWFAVDARPALAAATYLLLLLLPATVGNFGIASAISELLPLPLILCVIVAPALWRLRRQSARERLRQSGDGPAG
jgi:hypothetical protein